MRGLINMVLGNVLQKTKKNSDTTIVIRMDYLRSAKLNNILSDDHEIGSTQS